MHGRRARHRREAVRARSRFGAGTEPDPATATSTKRTSFASTTTWARGRCTTCCTSALPMGSWSRSGIAITWRACRSRWRRTSASRVAARSTTRPGTMRDVVQNHLFQVLANLAMEPPARTDSESIREEKVKVLKSVAHADAERHRARPVPWIQKRTRRCRQFDSGNVLRAAPGDQFLALARSAFLHSRRKVPAGHRHRSLRPAPAAAVRLFAAQSVAEPHAFSHQSRHHHRARRQRRFRRQTRASG